MKIICIILTSLFLVASFGSYYYRSKYLQVYSDSVVLIEKNKQLELNNSLLKDAIDTQNQYIEKLSTEAKDMQKNYEIVHEKNEKLVKELETKYDTIKIPENIKDCRGYAKWLLDQSLSVE